MTLPLYVTVSLFQCHRFRLLPDPHEHHYEKVQKLLHASGVADPLKREQYPYEALLKILIERVSYQNNPVYALDTGTHLITNSATLIINPHGITPGLLTVLETIPQGETCETLFHRWSQHHIPRQLPSLGVKAPNFYEFQRLQRENDTLKTKVQTLEQKQQQQQQQQVKTPTCNDLLQVYQKRLIHYEKRDSPPEVKNLDLTRQYETLQAREAQLNEQLKQMRQQLNLGEQTDFRNIIEKIQELKTILQECQEQKKVVKALKGPY